MNTLKVLGMALMLSGIGGMVWGSLDYLDHRHTLDLGDHTLILQEDRMPAQALIGLGLFIVGVVFTLSAKDGGRVRHA